MTRILASGLSGYAFGVFLVVALADDNYRERGKALGSLALALAVILFSFSSP